MNRSEKITLDQIKKLVPINSDLTNFAANITITAATDNPFLVAVVSQDVLENTTELPYKSIQKQVSLTLRNDNNKYEPYLLVLKSDTPQDVIVTINLQQSSPVTVSNCGKQTAVYPTQPVGNYVTAEVPSTSEVVWYKDWRYWFVIAAIVAVILYFYSKNRKEKDEPVIVEMSRYSNACQR